MAEPKLCLQCGTIGTSGRSIKGSAFTELLLWLTFIVPGVIYTIWRHSTEQQVCRKCGSGEVIPMDSPVARAKVSGQQIQILPEVAEDPARNDMRNGIVVTLFLIAAAVVCAEIVSLFR
jgi:hypothetical protein